LSVEEVLLFISRACRYRKWCRFTQNPLWNSNTGRGDSVPEDCCFAGCAGRRANATRREDSVEFPAARRMSAAIAAALRLLSRREGIMTRVGMVSPNPLPPLGSSLCLHASCASQTLGNAAMHSACSFRNRPTFQLNVRRGILHQERETTSRRINGIFDVAVPSLHFHL
jgi:hypothetical protein